jgi:hypothetical protein
MTKSWLKLKLYNQNPQMFFSRILNEKPWTQILLRIRHAELTFTLYLEKEKKTQ